MGLPFKLVSADSHIAEPADLWTKRIDKRFADRAPTIVHSEEGDYFVIDGKVPIVEGSRGDGLGLLATKRKYDEPEGYDFGFTGFWNDVPESAYDPIERVREIDREGIEAELIYTSFGLGMFALPDLDYRRACMIAFNDWLAEFCSAAPNRLFGIAMIPTDDLDRDVKEIERCAKMGMKGAMISISQGSGQDYSSPKFDKLWAAAAEHDLPISLHVAASETTFMATGNMWADFSCVFTPTMYSIVTMIFSGLFDRHENLKVVSVENDASWALAVLERMDDRWLHDRKWAWGDALIRPQAQRDLSRSCRLHFHARPDRDSQPRDHRQGQHHVGLGLPAFRRRMARQRRDAAKSVRRRAAGGSAPHRTRKRNRDVQATHCRIGLAKRPAVQEWHVRSRTAAGPMVVLSC